MVPSLVFLPSETWRCSIVGFRDLMLFWSSDQLNRCAACFLFLCYVVNFPSLNFVWANDPSGDLNLHGFCDLLVISFGFTNGGLHLLQLLLQASRLPLPAEPGLDLKVVWSCDLHGAAWFVKCFLYNCLFGPQNAAIFEGGHRISFGHVTKKPRWLLAFASQRRFFLIDANLGSPPLPQIRMIPINCKDFPVF